VLIPVDTPKGGRGPLAPLAEVSEEETRLEGIQRLTQMWQRHRYIPHDERRFHASLQQRRRDPNPLAIDYQTRDPSAVVRAHAAGPVESIVHGELPNQLFAEADLYHTNDFDMQKLSQHLQSPPPRGVTVLDRRWHWKLYYRCFRGDEFTSWLLVNFKDMSAREEAVRLGNELMKKGLFIHVQHKHHFRDGNYFYQFASEFRRTPYPDSRASWFSRMTDRSVPSTPSIDGPQSSPFSEKIRSRPSTDDSSDESGPGTPTRPSKLELSRVLQYDVDHRKRSYRPEIINLHYDRIHNPDNCYHIRIDWMGVTAKLIEDAIITWATSVERYGLKLVELPIAEASTITTQHPFRAPHKVALAIQPPAPRSRPYFDVTSFTAQGVEERFPYQKALLRNFDFVLDLEAASTFDSGVDVTYSWGKPDYKYTQFIHKSGTLVAQITDDGNFLLLANRLCVNRAASARDAGKFDRMEQLQGTEAGRRTPIIGPYVPGRGSRSPFASPLVRAVNDPAPSKSNSSHTRAGRPTSTNPEMGLGTITGQNLQQTAATADSIREAFERFCSNEQELQIFYEEALRPPPSPSPRHTPILRSTSANPSSHQTAGINSNSNAGSALVPGISPLSEAAIPSLGLPPLLNPGAIRASSYAFNTLYSNSIANTNADASPRPTPVGAQPALTATTSGGGAGNASSHSPHSSSSSSAALSRVSDSSAVEAGAPSVEQQQGRQGNRERSRS